MPNATAVAPSRRRPQARSWSRRLLTALATVAVVIGSILTVATSPAAAADEQDMIDRAYSGAETALLRLGCREYLAGPDFRAPQDRDPQQVLLTATITPAPVPADQPEGAIASAPFFGGAGSTIAVHPGFFDPDPSLPIAAARLVPTPDQIRTVALLHEVGHLTGREGDHNGDLARQFTYNATIVNLCLAGPLPLAPLRITSFTCGPMPRGTGYVQCTATWDGGVDPSSARWLSPRARRQPVVTTDPISRITTAAFDCNNPGGPELTFTTQVVVTDSLGTFASSAMTIPCGW